MDKNMNFDKHIGFYPNDWLLEKIGYFGDFYSGGTPSTTVEKYWHGDIVWLVPSDLSVLSDSCLYVDNSEMQLSLDGFAACSTKLLPEGTVCLSSRATIGEVIIAAKSLCTNQGFINVVTNDKSNNIYFLYWIKQNKNYIKRFSAGTTFLEISRRTFKRLTIAVPEPEEQKAIAGLLFKVDEAIAAVENSIKAAERLKKSLMQNLLTGKLKPDGSWRTDDEFYIDEKFGKVPVGWDIKRGIEITERITKGQSPKWQGFEYQQAGILFITSENVLNGQLEISNPKYLPIEFNNKIKNSQLKKGDILINIVGASIARSCIFEDENEIANINQAVCLFRPKCQYDSYYLAYFFQLEKTKSSLLCNQVETARANLSLSDFRKFKFLVPSCIEDQNSITNQIKKVDHLLIVKHQRVQTLKNLKKSLMQSLLTGKKRIDLSRFEALLKEMNAQTDATDVL